MAYILIAYLCGRAFFENSRKYLHNHFFMLVDTPTYVNDVFFLNIFLLKAIFGGVMAVFELGIGGTFVATFQLSTVIGFMLLSLFSNFRFVTDFLFKAQSDCFLVEKNLPHRLLSITMAYVCALLISDRQAITFAEGFFYTILIVAVFNLKSIMTEKVTPAITMEMRETMTFIQTEGRANSLHHALL